MRPISENRGEPWWTGSPVPHSRSGWQWQIGWSSPEVRDYNGNVQKVGITAEVVSCLISKQFPQWAQLEVRPVELDGWDNTTFRLGDDKSVRLPSHETNVTQIAAQLLVPIPRPIAKGRPGCGFPRPWSVYGWLEGEPAALAGVADHDRLADDLGHFVAALERISTEGGPAPGPHSFNRGGPVSAWDEQTRATIDHLAGEIDVAGALEVWEAAIAEEWDGPDVWVHGDLTGSNLLLRDDRMCGEIDYGGTAGGDPACDLTAAWTMFEGASRQRFMATLPFDPGTWARARGWALWKALIEIPGRPLDDPGRSGARFGWSWDASGVVSQVIADFRSLFP